MFSIFDVGRSFYHCHFKSSLLAKEVWAPLLRGIKSWTHQSVSLLNLSEPWKNLSSRRPPSQLYLSLCQCVVGFFFVGVAALQYSQWVQEGVEAGAEEQRQHCAQRHHIVEFRLQNAAMLTCCLCLIGWRISQWGVLQTAGEVLETKCVISFARWVFR